MYHTEGEVVKKVEATCIDSGYTLSRCQKCGLIYESDYEFRAYRSAFGI